MSDLNQLLESMADRAQPALLPGPAAVRAASERRTRRNRATSLAVVAAGIALVLGIGQLWQREHRLAPVQPVPIVPKVVRGLTYLTNHAGDGVTLKPAVPGPALPVLQSSTLNEVCVGSCSIVDYSWSPDARRLALLTPNSPDLAIPGTVLLLDHGRLRKLFDCPGPASASCDWATSLLAWSPSGSEIVFSSAGRLYVYDLRMHRLRVLDCGGCSGTAPAWSPDGAWIGYVAKNAVFRVPGQGGAPVKVTDTAGPSTVTWSPDGTRLAVTGADGLVVYAAASGRQLARFPRAENAARPTWSPDGSQLAFLSLRAGAAQEVDLAGSDGTGLRTLHRYSSAYGADAPTWSPDGKEIALGLGSIDRAHARWRGDIEVLDASSGAVRHHYAGFGPVAWLSR